MKLKTNFRKPLALAFMVLTILCLQACKKNFRDADVPSFPVTSASFTDGSNIPKQFTCDGANTSPALSWSSAPQKTQSFALIASDQDSPITFVHWVVYNLPPTIMQIAEGPHNQLPQGALQGTTNFDAVGYGGPCPPTGTHRYNFTIYALDSMMQVPSGANAKELRKAMSGHVLAEGNLMGRYHR